jgi:hypothetical protein
MRPPARSMDAEATRLVPHLTVRPHHHSSSATVLGRATLPRARACASSTSTAAPVHLRPRPHLCGTEHHLVSRRDLPRRRLGAQIHPSGSTTAWLGADPLRRWRAGVARASGQCRRLLLPPDHGALSFLTLSFPGNLPFPVLSLTLSSQIWRWSNKGSSLRC